MDIKLNKFAREYCMKDIHFAIRANVIFHIRRSLKEGYVFDPFICIFLELLRKSLKRKCKNLL